MMNEWQNLDTDNVPNDLFKEGAWEREHRREEVKRWVNSGAAFFIENGYRIRRPEGWEPKECPTCGAYRDQGRFQ